MYMWCIREEEEEIKRGRRRWRRKLSAFYNLDLNLVRFSRFFLLEYYESIQNITPLLIEVNLT